MFVSIWDITTIMCAPDNNNKECDDDDERG